MKKLILTACAAFVFLFADAQLKTPAASPTTTVKQDFGLGSVELSYSRPSLKNRTLYTDLAPTGKVWRTGANGATTLTFSDEVMIGGKKIPAGKYGLLSIPAKDKWTLIITKQTDVTSPAAYKQDQDVVRVDVKTATTESSTETFTIQFANMKSSSMEIHLLWGTTAVALPISMDVDAKVMSQIDNQLKKDNKPYFAAASYYLENGKDLNQALSWFDKAVEAQPTAFWIHHQRANCLAKLGKKADAKIAAEKSKELAAAAKNDDYVKLNDDLLKELK